MALQPSQLLDDVVNRFSNLNLDQKRQIFNALNAESIRLGAMRPGTFELWAQYGAVDDNLLNQLQSLQNALSQRVDRLQQAAGALGIDPTRPFVDELGRPRTSDPYFLGLYNSAKSEFDKIKSLAQNAGISQERIAETQFPFERAPEKEQKQAVFTPTSQDIAISQGVPGSEVFPATQQVQIASTQQSTGWQDPATGQSTPVGVGVPVPSIQPQAQIAPQTGITAQSGVSIQNRQFYRIGGDIFEAGTGRHIGPTEWARDWSGRATEISAPTVTQQPSPIIPTGSVDSPTTQPTQPISGEIDISTQSEFPINTTPSAPNPLEGIAAQLQGKYRDLYQALETQLQELQKRGQTINPNVEITPERVAEFTRQAETEINPYYQNQLRTTREQFLRSLGYSQEEVLLKEAELERQYGKGVRQIGEQAAEAGFALSGRRLQEEKEIAEQAQRGIEAGRRQLSFQAGTAARELAQRFGGGEITTPTISQAPRVLAGTTTFERPTGTRALYELSPEVYQGLVGSEEFERRGSVQRRASELEEAERSRLTLEQQRRLTL